MRPQAAWKVRIHIARATGPSRSSSRSRISPAALFVNVIARISLGFTPQALSRCATRAGYAPARLDPVHKRGLSLVHELERRTTSFEQDDASVVRAPVGDLLEPQDVAVEPLGLVEVGDRQNHPQLGDAQPSFSSTRRSLFRSRSWKKNIRGTGPSPPIG